MSYDPLDGEIYARHHHAKIRKADAEDSSGIHPLLSTPNEITALPSSKEMSKIFENLCGKKHSGHSHNTPDRCFLYYYSKCDPAGYGPSIPRTTNLPLDKTALPGKAPVLEHLVHLLETQDSYTAGGSYLQDIAETLKLCKSHRQVSESTLPQVHTLIFSRSSESEVKLFIDAFNSKIQKQESPDHGFLPHALYSFDVECVSSLPDVPFHIQQTRKGITSVRDIRASKFPARVHLGFHGERFDIVFPWEYTSMARDYRAEWTLSIPADPLHDHWHQLFQKLQGYGIGIGLQEDISLLNSFVATCFKFKNAAGPLKTRTLDLLVLLALAGYNSPKTSITALNFFFTGGIIQKRWEIRCGMGRWSSASALPHCLNLYLQSEAIGVLNTALVALMCILVHWFVTPGIAAVASRKPPGTFLSWFWRFVCTVLTDAHLPPDLEFSNCGDRSHSPRQLIAMIAYANGTVPVFSPEDLAACIPPWRNVTGGGCPSDQYAFDHILNRIWPMLHRSGVTLHLKWKSDIQMISSFLTGQPLPSAASHTSRDTGCNPDGATLRIPLLLPDRSAETYLTPRKLYRNYQKELPDSDPLKHMTSSQMLLLAVWQHPKKFCKIFAKDGPNGEKQFSGKDVYLLEPLVFALGHRGGLEKISSRLVFYGGHRRFKCDLRRAKFLTGRLEHSSIPAEKRRLRAKIRSISRRWSLTLPPLTSHSTSEQGESVPRRSRQIAPRAPRTSLPSGNPHYEAPVAMDIEPGSSAQQDEIPETRRVYFRSPSPDEMDSNLPDASSFELEIETQDWDVL
jgi:hypothetical protein